MHVELAGGARVPRVRGGARSLSLVVAGTLMVAALSSPAVASAAWKPTVGQVFAEQAASQRMITALVNNEIARLTFGKPARKNSSLIHVGVTAYFRAGGSLSGKLVMRRYKSKWYFYSITAGGAGGISAVTIPAGISSSALKTCVIKQASRQFFANGVRLRYFRTAAVSSVSKNWNTATIKLRLSGGSARKRTSTLTCISQTSTAGKQYWFMTVLK